MKKILVLFVALAILTCLVACSENENNSPTDETTEATVATTDPTQTSTAPTGTSTSPTTTDITTAPTVAPTQTATQKPTQSPTQKPTQTATQKPTQPATQAPTQKPTQASTQKPTQDPTQAPTQKPTVPPTQAPTKPAKTRFVSKANARYSADEKNGYSLWTKNDSYTYETKRYCIDYNGYVVFDFSEDERPLTNVKKNYFITSEGVTENSYTNVVYRLRQASTGKILFTTSTEEGCYVIDLEYSATKIEDDGYVIIVQMEESYDGVTYKLGILGADGKWVAPLSDKNPVIKTMNGDASLQKFRSMYYMGEGILYFIANSSNYFYNIEKNTVVEVKSELDDYDTKSVLQCADEFIDGISTSSYGWGSSICKISADGKITMVQSNFHEDLDENIGSYYYDRKHDRVIRMGYTYHQDGFSIFDSKGNIIKTLETVNIFKSNGFDDDGIVQLILQNNEETQYYTMMDTSGNFLFDPIKTGGCTVVDAESKLVISPDYNSKLHMLVDRNGNVLYKQEQAGDFSYNNGVVYDDGEYILVKE